MKVFIYILVVLFLCIEQGALFQFVFFVDRASNMFSELMLIKIYNKTKKACKYRNLFEKRSTLFLV